RKAAISCSHHPAISIEYDFRPAEVNHGLNGDDHALLEAETATRLAHIRNVRVLVHATPDAVTSQLTHNRTTFSPGELTDSVGYLAQSSPWPHRLNARVTTEPSHRDHMTCFRTDVTKQDHGGVITVEPIQLRSDVDVQNIPFLQDLLLGRDPVTDYVVPARAHGRGKALVSKLAGARAASFRVLSNQPIDGSRTH